MKMLKSLKRMENKFSLVKDFMAGIFEDRHCFLSSNGHLCLMLPEDCGLGKFLHL